MSAYRRRRETKQLRVSPVRTIVAVMTEPTPRATKRPATIKKPAHWTNDPAPQPRDPVRGKDPDGLDPTRFGDWERNGIAVDF